MPHWNPDQYLKFADERTRPCRDLARAVQLLNPQNIIDLGCGPGNSTEVLLKYWPQATIVGLDNSAEMIKMAREKYPQLEWQQADIANWHAAERYDLVFSNAALQWLPDHARLLPHLLQQVKPGGALAIQMPNNLHHPGHQAMRELSTSLPWQSYFSNPVRQWHVHEPAFYYDVLSPHASRLDLWLSKYFQVLPDPEAIVEWYKGTGLRPFLEQIPPDQQSHFLGDYLQLITKAYPRQADGKILFPFLRLFVVAYRN